MNPTKSCSICYCSKNVNFSLDESIQPQNSDFDGTHELVAALRRILKISDKQCTRQICEECHSEFRRIYTFLEQCTRTERLEFDIFANFLEVKDENESKPISPDHCDLDLDSKSKTSFLDEEFFEYDNRIPIENLTAADDPLHVEKSAEREEDFEDLLDDIRPVKVRMKRVKSNQRPGIQTKEKLEEVAAVDSQEPTPQQVDPVINKRRTRCKMTTICEFCELDCKDRRRLLIHRRIHILGRKDIYQCNYCPATYNKMEPLEQHLKRHEGVTYFCEQCGGEFLSLGLLREHQRTHTGRVFVCPECNWKFVRSKDFHNHLKTHADKTFGCDECNATFGKIRQLNAHKKIHSGDIFPCPYCPMKFMYFHLFRKHLEVHTSKKSDYRETKRLPAEIQPGIAFHSCDVCNARYDSIEGLETHKETQHSTFCCKICSTVFTCRKEMVKHRQIHAKRQYVCNECDTNFAKLSDLSAHKRIHTGKTLDCPECKATFLRPDRLREHMRIHTGELFNCDLCGLKFVAMYILNRHKKVMHNGKPYACSICDFKTRHLSVWKKHLSSHEAGTIPKNWVFPIES